MVCDGASKISFVLVLLLSSGIEQVDMLIAPLEDPAADDSVSSMLRVPFSKEAAFGNVKEKGINKILCLK